MATTGEMFQHLLAGQQARDLAADLAARLPPDAGKMAPAVAALAAGYAIHRLDRQRDDLTPGERRARDAATGLVGLGALLDALGPEIAKIAAAADGSPGAGLAALGLGACAGPAPFPCCAPDGEDR
jgi:hypothetical protein